MLKGDSRKGAEAQRDGCCEACYAEKKRASSDLVAKTSEVLKP